MLFCFVVRNGLVLPFKCTSKVIACYTFPHPCFMCRQCSLNCVLFPPPLKLLQSSLPTCSRQANLDDAAKIVGRRVDCQFNIEDTPISHGVHFL